VNADIKYAFRTLRRSPGFACATIVTLALGIAANGTVFTLLNGALLRDLPFDEPDRIVALRVAQVGGPQPIVTGLSYLELRDWQEHARTFEGIAGFDERTMNVSDEEHGAERFAGAHLSSDAFALLGQRPVLGRTLRAEDEREGATPVVVLGWPVWQARYRGSPDVIGRTIRVNGVPAVVVGVMPEGFGFPMESSLWRPLSALEPDVKAARQARSLGAFGRLRESTTIDQAHADLQGVISSLASAYPATNSRIEPRVEAFRSGIGGPIVALFAAMAGAVAFVLLIACANVANLLLARASTRAHEVAVRMAIGASRWHIVRQLLVESLVLAACAGLLGLALSAFAVRVFWLSASQSHPPYWMQFPIDGRVFGYIAAVCLGTAVVFGLVPALYTAKTNVVDAMTRGVTGGRRGRRWSAALVVGQLALTLVLLSGAGAMMRNLLTLSTMDAGVDTSSLIRMRLDLPTPAYNTPEQRVMFYRRLDERLSAIGLRASIASVPPGSGGVMREITVEGRADAPAATRPTAAMVSIGNRYFDTIGARQIRGRMFAAADGAEGRAAAIVNERFASMHFGDENALGRRIRLSVPGRQATAQGSGTEWMSIVGVVSNVQQRPPTNGGFDPVVYLPLAATDDRGVNILVRSTSTVGLVVSQVQEQLRALDPDLPIFDARTVDDFIAYLRWAQRVFGSMFAIFAVIALTLATVGLYAVTAYAVAQRTREIGLRIALGAGARHVWWLATRRASLQLITGLAIGLAGSLAVLRVLPMQAVRTDGDNSATLVAVSALLVVVALTACLIPARRALAVDPAQTLKEG
jgi:putative ABC transport system permease protein